MNRLANLALSVGETIVRDGGRQRLFGVALGWVKGLLGTPQQVGIRGWRKAIALRCEAASLFQRQVAPHHVLGVRGSS
jgi:hypothetical protein